jgi:hypothetical protein
VQVKDSSAEVIDNGILAFVKDQSVIMAQSSKVNQPDTAQKSEDKFEGKQEYLRQDSLLEDSAPESQQTVLGVQ